MESEITHSKTTVFPCTMHSSDHSYRDVVDSSTADLHNFISNCYLHTLPNELIEMIGKHLADKDLLSFRSSSRQLSFAVDRLFNKMFPKTQLVIVCSMQSLQRLVDISGSDRKSTVKNLEIYGFSMCGEDQVLYPELPVSCTRLTNFLLAQDHIQRTGKDISMLASALRNLNSCDSISIAPPESFWDTGTVATTMGNREHTRGACDCRDIELSLSEEKNLLGLMQSEHESGKKCEAATSLISNVIAAIVESGAAIHAMNLTVDYIGPVAYYIPTRMVTEYSAVLSNVKALRIRQTEVSPCALLTDQQWVGLLSTFLRCFKGMEAFQYSNNPACTHYSVNEKWLHALGSNAFEALSRLELYNVSVKSFESVLRVLEKHGARLSEIDIGNIYVLDHLAPGVEELARVGILCSNASYMRLADIFTYSLMEDNGLREERYAVYHLFDDEFPLLDVEDYQEEIIISGKDNIKFWLVDKRFGVSYRNTPPYTDY